MSAPAPYNRSRDPDEAGFTIPELLVVVLVIGVLAAIALPLFLGKADRAKDVSAKSNARNLQSLVQQCYSERGDYRQCDSRADLDGAGDLPYGTGPGEVEVSDATADEYTVTAHSQTSGHVFEIRRASDGAVTRSCTTPQGDTLGGCKSGSW